MTFKKFATKNLAALLLLPIGIALLMAFGNPLKTNDAKIALLRAEHGGGGGDRDIYDVLIQKAYKIYPDFAKWVVESRTAIAEASSFEKNISYLENRRDAYYKEAEAEAESIEDATLRESVMKKIARSKATYKEKLAELKQKLAEIEPLVKKLRDLEKALNVSYTLELLEKEYPLNLDMEKLSKSIEKLKELIAQGERDYYN